MERAAAPLEAARAIGRLEADGPWLGFGYRGGGFRFVMESSGGVRDAAADRDLILALAIAHFAGALGEPPPDLEPTQSDLSALVRHLADAEEDTGRRALLGEALDAIDDGLAGDAVAEKLEAARSHRDETVDPVELLSRKAGEIAASS